MKQIQYERPKRKKKWILNSWKTTKKKLWAHWTVQISANDACPRDIRFHNTLKFKCTFIIAVCCCYWMRWAFHINATRITMVSLESLQMIVSTTARIDDYIFFSGRKWKKTENWMWQKLDYFIREIVPFPFLSKLLMDILFSNIDFIREQTDLIKYIFKMINLIFFLTDELNRRKWRKILGRLS